MGHAQEISVDDNPRELNCFTADPGSLLLSKAVSLLRSICVEPSQTHLLKLLSIAKEPWTILERGFLHIVMKSIGKLKCTTKLTYLHSSQKETQLSTEHTTFHRLLRMLISMSVKMNDIPFLNPIRFYKVMCWHIHVVGRPHSIFCIIKGGPNILSYNSLMQPHCKKKALVPHPCPQALYLITSNYTIINLNGTAWNRTYSWAGVPLALLTRGWNLVSGASQTQTMGSFL